MFRQKVESLRDVLLRNLREQGLETPLLQKRLVEAWPQVVGPVIARYTLNTIDRPRASRAVSKHPGICTFKRKTGSGLTHGHSAPRAFL